MATTTAGPGPARQASAPEPPTDWVPADRRWAGLDRRTIGPALFVLLFAAVLNLGLPLLNGAVRFEDPVEPGDVMALGGGVRFVPAVGWNIVSGVRVGEEPASGPPDHARLVSGDVVYDVTVGAFRGDSRALVRQIKRTTDALNDRTDPHVTGDPTAVSTTAGDPGLLVHFHSPTSEGVLAAFVVGGTGVQVVAMGSQDLSRQTVVDVAGMITSLRFAGEEPA